jgi:hypothetical protein
MRTLMAGASGASGRLLVRALAKCRDPRGSQDDASPRVLRRTRYDPLAADAGPLLSNVPPRAN